MVGKYIYQVYTSEWENRLKMKWREAMKKKFVAIFSVMLLVSPS